MMLRRSDAVRTVVIAVRQPAHDVPGLRALLVHRNARRAHAVFYSRRSREGQLRRAPADWLIPPPTFLVVKSRAAAAQVARVTSPLQHRALGPTTTPTGLSAATTRTMISDGRRPCRLRTPPTAEPAWRPWPTTRTTWRAPFLREPVPRPTLSTSSAIDLPDTAPPSVALPIAERITTLMTATARGARRWACLRGLQKIPAKCSWPAPCQPRRQTAPVRSGRRRRWHLRIGV